MSYVNKKREALVLGNGVELPDLSLASVNVCEFLEGPAITTYYWNDVKWVNSRGGHDVRRVSKDLFIVREYQCGDEWRLTFISVTGIVLVVTEDVAAKIAHRFWNFSCTEGCERAADRLWVEIAQDLGVLAVDDQRRRSDRRALLQKVAYDRKRRKQAMIDWLLWISPWHTSPAVEKYTELADAAEMWSSDPLFGRRQRYMKKA